MERLNNTKEYKRRGNYNRSRNWYFRKREYLILFVVFGAWLWSVDWLIDKCNMLVVPYVVITFFGLAGWLLYNIEKYDEKYDYK